MRSAVVVISLVFVALTVRSQEWSDKAHYEAYMKGDWKEVVRLGKLAKATGADYYYIRARNGYANFMLGKYFKAEKEFEKALKFNSSDAFSKRYGYWSSVYAGNSASALMMTEDMSQSEKDTINVSKPKWFSRISVVGGYRASTSQNFVGDMPYVAAYFGHQFGKRISLRHGVSYLSQSRTAFINQLNSEIFQVGYLASLNIQVATHTTLAPSFIMQYWETDGYQVYDLSASLAIRQQFGNVNLTAIGGYFEDTDTAKFMVGASLTWYPLNNLKFYSITTGGYNFGGDAPNPFITETIGGNLFKRAWLSTSFTWNHQVLMYEDIGLDFANNSVDRLQWRWGLTPSYYITDKLGISLTYTVESRQFYVPSVGVGQLQTRARSESYNFHSFYVGLNYNF